MSADLIDTEAPVVPVAGARPGHRFGMGLAVAAAVGGVIRVWAVLAHYRDLTLGFTDNFFYSVQARAIAEGHGFIEPFIWDDSGGRLPVADHPPLYSLYLSVFSLVRDGPTVHRLASCLLGVTTVVLCGFAARAMLRTVGKGPRLAEMGGIAAAGVAAVYPPLWILDATLVSESLYAPFIAAVIWLSVSIAARSDLRKVVGLGVLLGAAALTRGEGLSLFAFLVIPLFALQRSRPLGIRVRNIVLCGLCGILVIAPWTIRNLRILEEPTVISVGAGYVLKVGNCDLTYYGERLGYWAQECAYAGFGDDSLDRSEHELRAREQALDYVDDHLDRLPTVVAARVGRMYELYRPSQGVDLNVLFERRGRLPSIAGLYSFYLVAGLAAVGLLTIRRRPLLAVAPAALFVVTTVTAATTFGVTRYRVGVDVALVILAGVGIGQLSQWLARRRRASAEP